MKLETKLMLVCLVKPMYLLVMLGVLFASVLQLIFFLATK